LVAREGRPRTLFLKFPVLFQSFFRSPFPQARFFLWVSILSTFPFHAFWRRDSVSLLIFFLGAFFNFLQPRIIVCPLLSFFLDSPFFSASKQTAHAPPKVCGPLSDYGPETPHPFLLPPPHAGSAPVLCPRHFCLRFLFV